jgi:hypothetical protein
VPSNRRLGYGELDQPGNWFTRYTPCWKFLKTASDRYPKLIEDLHRIDCSADDFAELGPNLFPPGALLWRDRKRAREVTEQVRLCFAVTGLSATSPLRAACIRCSGLASEPVPHRDLCLPLIANRGNRPERRRWIRWIQPDDVVYRRNVLAVRQVERSEPDLEVVRA